MRGRAARIADEVLFPAALDVDRADRIPGTHLDLLATEGFYGVAAPPEAGGLGVENMAVAADLVQTLASGCLTTAFVWIQHHGCLIATVYSQQPGLTERWLAPLACGDVRAGIAHAGARSGPDQVRLRRAEGGLVLDGTAPWVSGWDMIDVIHVAAVDDEDIVHFLIIDAVASPSLSVTPIDLVAAQASRTVNVRFRNHEVSADRLTGSRPYADWLKAEASGSALDGFLALGVVDRCRRLRQVPDWLGADAAKCRSDLLSGDSAARGSRTRTIVRAEGGSRGSARTVPGRAAASELALRAAATLAVDVGSRSVLRTEHAQRLFREAGFLLVFGSRPAIRAALLARLTG
jgi:alkylation response protein AidB-like acyl-CoA dehydrogenase